MKPAPVLLWTGLLAWPLVGVAQTTAQSAPAATATQVAQAKPTEPPAVPLVPLDGHYGPLRANNDLRAYDLDVRVDPEAKTIRGHNRIRFRMLRDDDRIQIDLHPALKTEGILLDGRPLQYSIKDRAVTIVFPQRLRKGRTYTIDYAFGGHPSETGRFGGLAFRTDPQGRPLVHTSCEGVGASIWFPNKDQWHDEPEEGVRIRAAVPNGLMNVSNGRFLGKKDLGDGYTRWDWKVSYPINNYNIALNIGTYVHFSDRYRDLTLDYYVLPENLDKAKKQFVQTKEMFDAYYRYFGEYPFKRDGYKLIEVPYAGMEHQSAVAYGNGYENGYYKRDWAGSGISLRFDFIIIHETGHEWFGNAVSAADRADMWIQEGWTTYMEPLYVEHRWGRADATRYLNGLKPKNKNAKPIVGPRDTAYEPPGDQYFKGALMLNTLRNVVNDDRRWFALIRRFYQTHKYRNIHTEDVVAFFNKGTGRDLTPVFDQYLRHAAIPVLELKFDAGKGTVAYRWKADESRFALPLRLGREGARQTLQVTTQWQETKSPLTVDDFKAAQDDYYFAMADEAQAAAK